MKIALVTILLASSLGWAQTPASAPDTALADLLARLQATAQKSDSDLTRLRIDKWKTDAAMKEQSRNNAAAIHRNLTEAVPELLQRVHSEPASLAANFRLYHNVNVLYDTFSALVESAGAFGPADQYKPLADDAAQLDRLRDQLAGRLDRLTAASDAEVLRLRTQLAASRPTAKAGPPPTRIVVDDNKPVARKKKRKKPSTVHKPSPAHP